MTYFVDFDFQCTLFSKNSHKLWLSIQNQTKLLEHYYGCFHRPLACFFTTKLSYAQLFNWGHSNTHIPYARHYNPRLSYFKPTFGSTKRFMYGASFLLKVLVLFTISLQNDHMEALEAPIWIQIKQKVSRMKFNIFSKILGP